MAKQELAADVAGCEIKLLEDGSAGALTFQLHHADFGHARLTLGRHLLERLRDHLDRELKEHRLTGGSVKTA